MPEKERLLIALSLFKRDSVDNALVHLQPQTPDINLRMA